MTVPATSPEAPQARLDWVDNLRTMAILLVVNMHVCVTYSHVGSWYYLAPPDPSIDEKIPFAFWQGHLQAFFMGLLFFIGGYFAHRSLTRRGPRHFLIERFRRLGIPTLIYMLVLHPFIVLVLHPGYDSPDPLGHYTRYLTSGDVLGGTGPMWFALALLIFSLPLAGLPSMVGRKISTSTQFRLGGVVGLGLVLAVSSFLVRTVQPIGASVLNFQLCYFVQYVVAFVLGVAVSQRSGLEGISTSPLASKAGWFGLVGGPILLLGVLIASQPLPANGPLPLNGGWNGLAFAFALWEQMVGTALALGAIWFCRRWFARRSRLSSWLSDRSFGVYLLHPPVLVAISLLVQPVRSGPFVMVPLVTVLALAASFVASDLAHRLPGLRSLL